MLVSACWQVNAGKLAQKLELQSGPSPAKKKKTGHRLTVRPSLADHFRPADVSGVRKVADVLSGKEICVINGKKETGLDKKGLEVKVAELGGECVQHPGNANIPGVVICQMLISAGVCFRTEHFLRGRRIEDVASG